MTKFILHRGFSKEKGLVQEDNEFFQKILEDTPEDIKLLLVYFAEREERIELRIEQDKESFNKNKGSKNIQFKIASEENFIKECKWADVIYLHGGKTVRLMEVLKKYQNLENVFLEKIIAGDSAGANVLGQLFYSKNSKEISEGLRILPYKIVAHHIDGNLNPLKDTEPNLETIFLKEYETKVFYI